jgi:hypothetical protein
MADKDNYWQDVEDIAREVIESKGTNEDHWHDAIHENVDGNSWIIYYGNNEEVLSQTNNEPDNDEIASMCNPKGGWQDMRMTAAYLAMERDVWDKCRELVDEYEPAYFMLRRVSNKQFLTGADFKADWRDEDGELGDPDYECLETTYNDYKPEEDGTAEDVKFEDKDTAEEVKAAWESFFKGEELEIIVFNEDDTEIPLVDE